MSQVTQPSFFTNVLPISLRVLRRPHRVGKILIMSVTIVTNYIIWEQIVSFTDGNSEQNSLHLSIWEQCFIYSWELRTMIFLFYTTVNLLLLPCKQPFLAVLVNRKTKTIKVDTRGTLLLKYGNSQRDLKSVRATTWRKIQKALKWNGSNIQNLVNFIALKGRKKIR